MGCVNQLTTGDNLGWSETKSFRRYPRKSNRTQRSHGICCGNAVWIWQIWRFRRTVVWTLNDHPNFSSHHDQHLVVGGLEHVLFFHILGIIIPTDFHIFRGVGSTTNQKTWVRKKLPSWSLARWAIPVRMTMAFWSTDFQFLEINRYVVARFQNVYIEIPWKYIWKYTPRGSEGWRFQKSFWRGSGCISGNGTMILNIGP